LNLQQITGKMSQSKEDPMKEQFAIQVITGKCSRQSMAAALHNAGYTMGLGM